MTAVFVALIIIVAVVAGVGGAAFLLLREH